MSGMCFKGENLPIHNENRFSKFVVSSYQACRLGAGEQLLCGHIAKPNQVHDPQGKLNPFLNIVHKPPNSQLENIKLCLHYEVIRGE